MVRHRAVHAAFVALTVLALGASAAAQSGPSSSARALGVRVVLPDGTVAAPAAVSAPPATRRRSTGGATARARSSPARPRRPAPERRRRGATAEGAPPCAPSRCSAARSRRRRLREAERACVRHRRERLALGLVALGPGRPRRGGAAGPNGPLPLGDWGYAVTLGSAVVRTQPARATAASSPGCTSSSRPSTAGCRRDGDHGRLRRGGRERVQAETARRHRRLRRRPRTAGRGRGPAAAAVHAPQVPPTVKPSPPNVKPKLTAGRLRLPGLRARVLLGQLRRPADDHLAPRRRHLRPAGRADPGRRRRDALPRRLERRRRQPLSGSATARGTSSTTPTSRPSRRSRRRGRR